MVKCRAHSMFLQLKVWSVDLQQPHLPVTCQKSSLTPHSQPADSESAPQSDPWVRQCSLGSAALEDSMDWYCWD